MSSPYHIWLRRLVYSLYTFRHIRHLARCCPYGSFAELANIHSESFQLRCSRSSPLRLPFRHDSIQYSHPDSNRDANCSGIWSRHVYQFHHGSTYTNHPLIPALRTPTVKIDQHINLNQGFDIALQFIAYCLCFGYCLQLKRDGLRLKYKI